MDEGHTVRTTRDERRRERRVNVIIFVCTILAIPVAILGVGALTVEAGVAAYEVPGCLDGDGNRDTWLKQRTVGAVGFHHCDPYAEGAGGFD